MRYVSGEYVELRDCVMLEHGRTEGVVQTIIEAPEQMAEWGVDEPGLLLESEQFGLVFWPESEPYDPVIFVSRQST
ncbi:hypothetical protein A9179_13605 [Pseudomonas alcaligenes]|uniref:Uncharacterized protein n=1 Tax=Aquipseudomonas alcaligenes TaxID=43263 RepID=A0ABR7S152_AQUAC|nr:hypothetical protein [Pseudomonas alcaligenes]MBC9251305.1 hypothetical protein [Pseudomonas alcaligenes]